MSSYSNFSYWFSDTIVDPQGKTVSDINKGIRDLIPGLIDQLNNLENDHTKFIPSGSQDGQPDSVAYLKYGNQNLWWYVCLSSCLENPFTEFSHGNVLFAFNRNYLSQHAQTKESKQTPQGTESKIGQVIELN